MEALIAVGLAGNVVQFVQFAGKLVSETVAIHNKGTPTSVPELRHISEVLTNQASLIASRLKASSATLAQEEQSLLDVATDCHETGIQFLALLDSIAVNPQSRMPLKTLRASLKYNWMGGKVEEFTSKIERFRSALTLATILALRSNTNSNNDKVVAHLKEIQRDVASHARDGRQLGDVLGSIQKAVDVIQRDTGPKLDSVQQQIETCLRAIKIVQKRMPLGPEGQVLRWINFRQVSWRYEEVPLAYRKTFEWIFRKPRSGSPSGGWNDFPAFLRSNDIRAPYFINGKAGSGKSTLMKSIVDDRKTTRLLASWTGTSELHIAKHFFWNLGTALQKSTTGMLRTLVHGILERYPELIPAVLPNIYWKQSDYETEPTYMEMKKVFESVMKRSSGFLKLCIFIDGIDEYDGDDHRDLCLFLRSLSSANLKIIVSSRPIPACISIFEDCPSLRLQDLTRRDMDVFVRGELSSHRLMIGMQRRFPEACRDIITNIKDKAEGVFLWVKLVVRELIEGLEAGDDIKELQARMRSLPSDLKDLYRRMIGKMQQEYQVQAAEIFQLFHRWNMSTGDEPLEALVLSLVTQSPSTVFNAPVAPFNRQEVVWLAQHIESRVRSRCCGLIEFRNRAGASKTRLMTVEIPTPVQKSEYAVVAYLHRTVAEFLTTIEVWEEICGMTKGSGFDPMQNFASAYLSLTKAANGFGDPLLPSFITNAVGFCRMSTDISDETFTKYVSAIDDTVTQLQHGVKNKLSLGFLSKDVHWSVELFNYVSTMHEPFESPGILIFAAHNALLRYLKTVIPLREIAASTWVAIAIQAIESWQDPNCTPWAAQSPPKTRGLALDDRSATLQYILRHAVNHQDTSINSTLWHRILVLAYQLRKAGKFFDFAQLLKIFADTVPYAQKYMSTPVYNKTFGKMQTRTLIDALLGFKDEEIRTLGSELQHLACKESAASDTYRFFSSLGQPVSVSKVDTQKTGLEELDHQMASLNSSRGMTNNINALYHGNIPFVQSHNLVSYGNQHINLYNTQSHIFPTAGLPYMAHGYPVIGPTITRIPTMLQSYAQPIPTHERRRRYDDDSPQLHVLGEPPWMMHQPQWQHHSSIPFVVPSYQPYQALHHATNPAPNPEFEFRGIRGAADRAAQLAGSLRRTPMPPTLPDMSSPRTSNPHIFPNIC